MENKPQAQNMTRSAAAQPSTSLRLERRMLVLNAVRVAKQFLLVFV